MHIELTVFVFIFNLTFKIKNCFTVFKRFEIFRCVGEADMKDGTRFWCGASSKGEKKQAVSDEDEELFWRNGLSGQSTVSSIVVS